MFGKRMLFGAASLCLLCTSCFFLPQEEELPAAPVVYNYQGDPYETVEVMRGDVVESLNLSCEYSAIREEELKFKISGEVIDEVFVQQGEAVKPGTLLAQLEMGNIEQELVDCEDRLEWLTLQLKQMRTNRDAAYERQEEFLAALPKEDRGGQQTPAQYAASYIDGIEELQDGITVQELKMEELKRAISKRQIVATITGSVSFAKPVADGELSRKDILMFKVSDSETSAFIASSREKNLFKIGDAITMVISKEERAAKVISPSDFGLTVPTEKKGEQFYYFQLESPDFSLKNGDKATVTAILKQSLGVLFLPDAAIRAVEGKSGVYFENEDGIREIKFVEVGLVADHKAEIKSGVKEGEIIITG